jgi:hypothetical protein
MAVVGGGEGDHQTPTPPGYASEVTSTNIAYSSI